MEVSGLEATIEGQVLFKDVDFYANKGGGKFVFLSKDPRAMTTFFEIINGHLKADGRVAMSGGKPLLRLICLWIILHIFDRN